MANVPSTVSGNATIMPVMEMMKDVIQKEDNRQILQTDLRRMESLLQYTAIIFRDQHKDPPEMVKIWLQLLQNSLTEANGFFHRWTPHQSCIHIVVCCNPGRLSKEIRDWNAVFDHLYDGFLSDLVQHFSFSGNVSSTVPGNATIMPVMEMMKDVIQKEDIRQILQTDLRRMESLLQYTAIIFRDQHKDPPELVKIWLQLLQNSLTEANGLFHRWTPRQSCIDIVLYCNPGRLSKEIRDWNAFFDHLYDGFLSDLVQHTSFSGNAMISQVIHPTIEQLKAVIKEEDNRRILRTDLRRMENLLLDVMTLFRDEPDVMTLFQSQKKAHQEIVKRLQSLQTSLTEAKRRLLIDRWVLRQSCTDRVPRRLSRQIRDWNASFDEIYHGFQSELSIFVTSLQFLSSNPLHIQEKAKEPDVIQPHESWKLFCRVAFKDEQVSTDIEDRARKIAEQCRGLPLAISVVAAAMIGQTSLHEWDFCLSSLQKNIDPSFPATDSGLDAEMYAALPFSYDALPNSDVKECFIYCALYQEDEEIDALELVQMWIGEGLVKSKQGTHLMDTAIGRKYLKLLVDRCLFQTVRERTNVFKQKTIRVQSAIRDMAIYIGQNEENSLVMANRNQRDFPVVPVENSRRISLASNFKEDLMTQLRCPELATLILKGHKNLKEFPSDFLLRVASLRVLNLSAVPTSIEELTMLELKSLRGPLPIEELPKEVCRLSRLEFLSLRELPIEELPKEVCRLSRLQCLDLSKCRRLKSLPSEIGEIQNLKCLNLDGCDSLEMIPRQMSELTSLSRLVMPGWRRGLSMETEAAASIWSLKGLKNMTELSVWMGQEQHFKDGIMGTWSEMRHLMLSYDPVTFHEELHEDLPEDMKSMKKLQSFMLSCYGGYHCLPNCCKFEHLEMVSLCGCDNIKELSPLEWMPNLKLLKLWRCDGLRELGIGSRGGYQRLQKLVLKYLRRLESLGGASKTEGVWDERTLPNLLRVLKIRRCRSLKRFPVGMEKLPNLCALMGSSEWWESITFQDETMKIKIKLQNIFNSSEEEQQFSEEEPQFSEEKQQFSEEEFFEEEPQFSEEEQQFSEEEPHQLIKRKC